jgi:hypothetical protein
MFGIELLDKLEEVRSAHSFRSLLLLSFTFTYTYMQILAGFDTLFALVLSSYFFFVFVLR